MTRNIDFTTESVVLTPSETVLPATRNPSAHATAPISSAMQGALMRPTSKSESETAFCNRAMNVVGSMPP